MSERAPRTNADGAERAMRGLAYALGATLVALTGWVVVARFRYPVDGEWMTGAVRDAVDRLRDGKPLYAEPSARFVPFLYTPLYYWLSSLVARVCSTFVACKLVSIAATGATGWGIYRISRTLGASTFWSRMGLLFHVASYSLTTMFYDLERVDTLSAAVVIVGLAVLLSHESMRGSAIAGAILGAAFFAKQPGLLAFVAVVFALALARERKRALVVAGAGAASFIALFVYLTITTGPWFKYYCVTLPGTHGVKGALLTTFFIIDLPKAFAYTAATVALSVPLLWAIVRRKPEAKAASWKDVVFAVALGASLVAGFFMRAHLGGWPNVLVVWLPLACAAVAVAGTRAEEWGKQNGQQRLVNIALLGIVCIQFLGAMFDPNELSPNHYDLEERERLVSLVRKMEKSGDVLLTTTGNVTAQTSVHAAALFDIVRAGHAAPADLIRALEERRYAALIVGTPDEFLCDRKTCDDLVATINKNYFVAARRHERPRTGMSGFDARPRWVMRPRKEPVETTDLRQILLRMHLEMGFAEVKLSTSGLDDEVEPADEIEGLAAAELRSRPAPP